MLRIGIFVLALLAPVCAFALIYPEERIMRRGDSNNDDYVDMSDGMMINNWLFNGGPEPPCLNQADANDDGRVDASDSSFIFNWLFNGGPPPPSPGPFNTVCKADLGLHPGCAIDPCQ